MNDKVKEDRPILGDPMIPMKQSAQELGIGVSTLYRGIADGRFPQPVKMGKRARRYALSTLEKLKKQAA